jgi:hypothetical protein
MTDKIVPLNRLKCSCGRKGRLITACQECCEKESFDEYKLVEAVEGLKKDIKEYPKPDNGFGDKYFTEEDVDNLNILIKWRFGR